VLIHLIIHNPMCVSV